MALKLVEFRSFNPIHSVITIPKKRDVNRSTAGGEDNLYPNFVRNPTQDLSPFNMDELAIFLEQRKHEFQLP